MSVGRVVSLVRPRLISHVHGAPGSGRGSDPRDLWPVSRIWRMKVYFVPEAAGMLLLGAGIATLLGVARMRRR